MSHSIDRPQAEISESKAKRPRTQQKLIVSYVEKKCQDEMYAAFAATDRLSFNQIANSSFIKDVMRKKEMSDDTREGHHLRSWAVQDCN